MYTYHFPYYTLYQMLAGRRLIQGDVWKEYALLSNDYIILKLFHFRLIRQHLLEPKHYVICVIDKMYWALFYILFYSISINVDKDTGHFIYIFLFFR